MPPHRSPPSSTSSSSLPSSQDALLSPSSTLSRFSSSSDDIEAPYSDTDDHQLSSEKPAHSANARNKWPASAHASQLHRRKRLLATVALLAVLLVASAFFASSIISSNSAADIVRQANNNSFSNGDTSNSVNLDEHVDQGNEDLQNYSPYVLGEPTDKFRDNLRQDVLYITAWINAGWTNDVMTYMNLVYLALLSNRTTIIPPFAPSHVGSSAGFVHFSEVFDIQRLTQAIQSPVIEWQDVKNPESTSVDELGCWSVWATANHNDENKDVSRPRGNSIEGRLKLDVAYTPVPDWTILLPEFPHDPHTRFGPLSTLTYPSGREVAHLPAEAPYAAPQSGHHLLPDEHLACFDFLYYVSTAFTFEFNFDFSPAWRYVGRHFRWSEKLEAISRGIILETLGVSSSVVEGEEVRANTSMPPFISIHVRHGDFGNYCGQASSKDECFAPLSAYAQRVSEVREELSTKYGIDVDPTHVLVTSDEQDEEWWDGVRALGWKKVDHKARRTEERFGRWYPIFVDAVVQSLGVGFVGTDRSTMSLIAQRRVQDWARETWKDVGMGDRAEGVTRIVKWGSRDADAHKRSLGLVGGGGGELLVERGYVEFEDGV